MKAYYLKFSLLSVSLWAITVISLSAQPTSNFTMEGKDRVQWSENFESGNTGWKVETTNEDAIYNWQWKDDLTGNKSFSGIDPENIASMSINGVIAPRYGEQNELLISPAISIPGNASIQFYGGYSLGNFAVQSIKLKVSENRENWTEIWDAETNSPGGKAFEFRLIKVDLSAYENQTLSFMWEYKARASAQNMPTDFVLDGIEIVTPDQINQKQISAGESVKFYNTSTGNATSLLWEFEGGTPETSTENNPIVHYYRSGTYSVKLTATNAGGSDVKTNESAVVVNDIAPVVHIGAPTKLKTQESRNYFVPYLEEIRFKDESENYPSRWNWAFTGGKVITSASDQNPVVLYDNPGIYKASLTARNDEGEDTDEISVEAGYSSFVWNMNKGETVTDYFQMDENEYFPGNNTRIEAYAEYFDKPAAPAFLDSMDIRFVGYQLGDDILHQIGDIQVKIHKAENGQPGEQLAWTFYGYTDINADGGRPSGIWFGGDLPIIVDFPFFVVVEDIPMSSAEGLKMVMGMASWRNYGNTAYLKRKGEDTFIPANSYFGEDKQTSFWISPRLKYMILHPEKNELTFEKNKSEQTINVYATFEWTAESNQSWCKIKSTNTGEREGSLTIECDANITLEQREATVTLTDEGNTKTIKIIQKPGDGTTGINNSLESKNTAYFDAAGNLHLESHETAESFSLYTIEGKKVMEENLNTGRENSIYNLSHLPKGIYVLRFNNPDSNSNGIKIIK